jgi:hypothetical protein
MTVKVSKYFDDVFHSDDNHRSGDTVSYTLNFNGTIQEWRWCGRLDRNNNRILHNNTNYASDTYLAINAAQEIVGGYSFILEQNYEGIKMELVPNENEAITEIPQALLLPTQQGICKDCTMLLDCPMIDALAVHRQNQHSFGDYYEDSRPDLWCDDAIDDVTRDPQGLITWCPLAQI